LKPPVAAGEENKMALNLRGKLEIENPTYKVGDIVKVKFFAIHAMENGVTIDKASGSVRPADYIKSIKISFNGEEIASFEIGVSTSQNPKIVFPYKISGAGTLKAEIEDNNGEKTEKTMQVTPK
jgi:thiosulfate oxidation carrier complex protein SoxZ